MKTLFKKNLKKNLTLTDINFRSWTIINWSLLNGQETKMHLKLNALALIILVALLAAVWAVLNFEMSYFFSLNIKSWGFFHKSLSVMTSKPLSCLHCLWTHTTSVVCQTYNGLGWTTLFIHFKGYFSLSLNNKMGKVMY